MWSIRGHWTGSRLVSNMVWRIFGANPFMMTSSNENIFRVTGPLRGNSSVTDEFSLQRPVMRSFDIFFDLRVNNRDVGDLRRHCAYYNVTVMFSEVLKWRNPSESRSCCQLTPADHVNQYWGIVNKVLWDKPNVHSMEILPEIKIIWELYSSEDSHVSHGPMMINHWHLGDDSNFKSIIFKLIIQNRAWELAVKLLSAITSYDVLSQANGAETHQWEINIGLTHLPLDKMAAVLQTIFSYPFSWMKSFVFWSNFTKVCS